MKKKGLLVAVLALLIVGSAIGATLAFFTDSQEQKNTFTMGKVDITLTEPSFSAEHENNTIKDVIPNMLVKKDPTIHVAANSEDVYIRASINYGGLSENEQAQLEANIHFIKGWTKGNDGKFYYNKSLTANDTILLFDYLLTPEEWGNDNVVNGSFTLTVNAEAIQKDYFTPTTDASGNIIDWTNKNGESIVIK